MSAMAVAGPVLSCTNCVLFRTPGTHRWIAGVVFFAGLVGIIAVVALAHMALSSRGRRRWGLVLCIVSLLLLVPAAAAVLVGVDTTPASAGGDFVDCGRPLLSRPDIDVADRSATVSKAAAYCQDEFANRRRVALAVLLAALAAGIGAGLLLVPLRSGDEHSASGQSPESDPVPVG